MKTNPEFKALPAKERRQAILNEFEEIRGRLRALGTETARFVDAVAQSEQPSATIVGHFVNVESNEVIFSGSEGEAETYTQAGNNTGVSIYPAGTIYAGPVYPKSLLPQSAAIHHATYGKVAQRSPDTSPLTDFSGLEAQNTLLDAAEAFERAARLLLNVTEDTLADLRREREITRGLLEKIEASLGVASDAG